MGKLVSRANSSVAIVLYRLPFFTAEERKYLTLKLLDFIKAAIYVIYKASSA